MKNLFPILAFVLLAIASTNAQKIDIDKETINTTLINFPSRDVDSSFQTFSYTFKGSNILTAWGINSDEAQDKYIKLEGYTPVPSDGDLQLEVNLSSMNILGSDVISRVEKSKDKAGREISTYYYRHVITYEMNFSWRMLDRNGKDMSRIPFLTMVSATQKHQLDEYKTYKEASDSYYNNRVAVNRDIATREILGKLGGMQTDMNRLFGYRTSKEKFKIWVLASSSHPEYQAQQDHYNAVKVAFENIQVSGVTAENLEALAPALEYYKSIPGKYAADEKAHIKLRYAAYYNLAVIHLHLDQFDEAVKNANLLILNDYDKGDGKDIMKEVGNVKEMLEKKKYNSRRFQRVSRA